MNDAIVKFGPEWWKRTEEKCTKTDAGCILFNGFLNSAGYGITKFRDASYLAHRLSWLINNPNNTIADGIVVRHACASKNCIAPSHLSLGTKVENAADKVRDGTNRFGDNVYNAAITNAVAAAIYASKGDGTAAERAIRFGVPRDTVFAIDNHSKWIHVTAGAEAAQMHRQTQRARVQARRAKPLTDAEYAGAYTRILKRTSPGANGCLIMDAESPKKYIGVHIAGRVMLAHRIVWQHKKNNNQPVPQGMHVRHLCGNAKCVQPVHLEIGTPVQNAHDKFTDEQKQRAREIFEARDTGTRRELAARFGVSIPVIHSILHGDSWSTYSGYSEEAKKRKREQ